jgi:hypothetical protein
VHAAPFSSTDEKLRMPRGHSISTVIEASIGGARAALRNYQKLCGHAKWWLDEAPEYYLTVRIAEAIYKATADHVWFEYNMRETRVEGLEGRGELRGRPSSQLKKAGRHDVVVFRKSSARPWCVIEVKSPIYSMNELVRADVLRLINAVSDRSKGGSIAYGMLVFYSSRGKGGKLKSIEAMAGRIKSFAEDKIRVARYHMTASCTVRPLIKSTSIGCCAVGCLVLHAHRRHA